MHYMLLGLRGNMDGPIGPISLALYYMALADLIFGNLLLSSCDVG